MTDINPRKRRIWPLRQRHSDLHLSGERGTRAAEETELSSPQPSQIPSGKGPLQPVKKLFRRMRNISVPAAGRSPNPAPVDSSSNTRSPIPDHIRQGPPADTAPAPEQNTGQATNSGTAKNEPDLKERLADTQKAIAGMRDFSGNVRSTASATNDVQSGCDAVGAVSSTIEPLLQPLRLFHSVADEIAKIHPYARVAMSILTFASKMILAQTQLDDDVRGLLEKISQVYDFMNKDGRLADVPSMQILCEKMARQILECVDFITHYSDITSAWERLRKNILKETTATIQNYSNVLDTLMQRFRDLAARDTVINVQNIDVNVHRMVDDLDFKDMVHVDGAGRDTSKCCLQGTRESILSEIKDWINRTGEDAQQIFWLSGTAGKGKSAIAHTIANWFDGPGACFCFDRTREAERCHEKIFTTIARDLAYRDPIMRRALASAVGDDEMRHTKDVARQWKHFILGPVGAACQVVDTPVLVVIDALDESGDARSRKEILRMLTGNVDPLSTEPTKLPAHLRILITSRPLEDIHNSLHGMQHVHHVSIDDSSLMSAERDIQYYMSTELANLGDTFNDDHFQRLAKQSDGLFEWARLACEYIKGTNKVALPPKRQFDALVARKSGKGTRLLDDMYRLVLEESMPKDGREDVIPMFCSVMRQILVLSEPLPATALNAMRQHFPCEDEHYDVNHVIGKLGSLVTGTDSTAPVRPLHASFYDFLTDKSRSNEFFIDASLGTSDLAFASLRVMEHGLRFNICSLESSYLPNSSVLDLEERVKKSIPAELSYSCRWWGMHVGATRFQSLLAEEIRAFFDAERLLFWLEALALMKGLSGSVGTLTSISNWFTGHAEYADISSAIRHIQRFIRTFAPAIVHSTPHLYLSALPFSPTHSTIFEKFVPNFPRTPRVLQGYAENWPPMEKIMHTDSYVYAVPISPDGKRIVSGMQDGTIQVWDAETGEALGAPFRGHTAWVHSVAISPDGTRIVSGSSDKTIRMWDAETGKPLGPPLQGHTSSVESVAISPDGTRIVSGSSDKTIRMWDAETGKPLGAPLQGHTDVISSVAISPDGSRIVSGSWDNTICMWDAETGKALGAPLQGHTGDVSSVAISPDGTRIVSGSQDKTIRMWDAETGKPLGAPLQGHTDGIRSVAISPDGTRIVSGSEDKTIRMWDAETGKPLGAPQLQGYAVFSVAISPDGTRIVSGSSDQTIWMWDAETGKALGAPLQGHTDGILSVAISPDGSCIVSGSYDKTIRMWDAETGKPLGTPLHGHTYSVNSVAISPDETRIVSGSQDKTIWMWDAETGKALGAPFQGHTGDVFSVAISPDGTRIVSGAKDNTIRMWDAETGKPFGAPLQGHTRYVESVAISPDGTRIVSGSLDKTIRMWDAETGKPLGAPLQGHTSWVLSVAISPDGTRIVSGSLDQTIRMWDAETGKPLGAPLQGHTERVRSVAISPDGSRIVSGSWDKTIRMWDAETGKALGPPLQGHTDWVLSVAISPDGTRIVSGSADGTIRVWVVESFIHSQAFNAVVPAIICFSSNPTHALCSTSSFLPEPSMSSLEFSDLIPNEERWIVGPEGRLLLWIPSYFPSVMYVPGTTLVMPNALQLDLSHFSHGTSWQMCRK